MPLKTATVDLLKVHLKGKMPGVRLFNLSDHTAKMIKTDLESARKAWIGETESPAGQQRAKDLERDQFLQYKTEAGQADFHSLRHTCGTNLIQAGADIKTVQTIMRHSDPAMTLSVYSHTDKRRERQAIEALPDYQEVPEEMKLRAVSGDENSVPKIMPKPCPKMGKN